MEQFHPLLMGYFNLVALRGEAPQNRVSMLCCLFLIETAAHCTLCKLASSDTKEIKAVSLGIFLILHEHFTCIPRRLCLLYFMPSSPSVNASSSVPLSSYIMVIYFNVSVMWNRAYFKEQITQGNNITQKKVDYKRGSANGSLHTKSGINCCTGVLEGRPLTRDLPADPGFTFSSRS